MFLLMEVQKECMNSCWQPAWAFSIPVGDLVDSVLPRCPMCSTNNTVQGSLCLTDFRRSSQKQYCRSLAKGGDRVYIEGQRLHILVSPPSKLHHLQAMERGASALHRQEYQQTERHGRALCWQLYYNVQQVSFPEVHLLNSSNPAILPGRALPAIHKVQLGKGVNSKAPHQDPLFCPINLHA